MKNSIEKLESRLFRKALDKFKDSMLYGTEHGFNCAFYLIRNEYIEECKKLEENND